MPDDLIELVIAKAEEPKQYVQDCLCPSDYMLCREDLSYDDVCYFKVSPFSLPIFKANASNSDSESALSPPKMLSCGALQKM